MMALKLGFGLNVSSKVPRGPALTADSTTVTADDTTRLVNEDN